MPRRNGDENLNSLIRSIFGALIRCIKYINRRTNATSKFLCKILIIFCIIFWEVILTIQDPVVTTPFTGLTLNSLNFPNRVRLFITYNFHSKQLQFTLNEGSTNPGRQVSRSDYIFLRWHLWVQSKENRSYHHFGV
jgi:hypothetical protein